MPSRTIARMLFNRVNYFCSKKSELSIILGQIVVIVLIKPLESERKVKDDCLMVFRVVA